MLTRRIAALAAWLALLAAPVGAQVTVGSSVTAGTVASASSVTTGSLDSSTGNLMALCLAWTAPAGSPTLSTVEFGSGNTVTANVIHTVNGISDKAGGLYYVTGLSGSQAIIVTLSGAADRIYASAVMLANVDTGSPLRGGSGVETTATGTSITVNVASTDANDIIVDCWEKNGGVSEGTVGANQTQFGTQGSGSASIHHRASTQDGADGTAMSWSWGTAANAWLAAASFQAGAGGATRKRLASPPPPGAP